MDLSCSIERQLVLATFYQGNNANPPNDLVHHLVKTIYETCYTASASRRLNFTLT